ncbi:MAG: hypothetical protein HPY53_09750 [Brevinematales bacterium]|nr:hypothetical protein [Brevinematales bacterium]
MLFFGEVSTNHATYTLRGEDITAPFVKVQYGWRDTNASAWVFQGALKTYTESGINTNLGLIDAIKCSNVITVKYLIENWKISSDGDNTTIGEAVKIAFHFRLFDIAEYLLKRYYPVLKEEGILDCYPVPKTGEWFFTYITNIFEPKLKVITNYYNTNDENQISPGYDIDHYYQFGVRIKEEKGYSWMHNEYYIPYISVEEAFVLMKKFKSDLWEYFVLPTKSGKKLIQNKDLGEHLEIHVEYKKNHLIYLFLNNGDSFLKIEQVNEQAVKISHGGGA